jgi:Mg2+-importing ATPase
MEKKEDFDVQKTYGKIATLSKADFIKGYGVDENGLSNVEANLRFSKNGANEIKSAKPKKWYNYFFKSLFSPFNSILIGIALLLAYTDVYLAEIPSYASIIVISILVLSSTLLDFFSEYRSNLAAEKLKELVATTATVMRNGEKVKIPLKNVVVGDVVILSAGDMIPADTRIIEAKDLYVGQSSLTGESDAIKKVAESGYKIDEIDNLSDIDTICFMGTNVISGSAKGVIVLTANDTYFGKVASNLGAGKPKTNFQKNIENISRLLIKFMLVLIPIVFLVTATKHSVLTSFTFAVAIAIGITPLLLPVILSTCLSKGALRMSKKKTIVKKLDSIQSFGGMNILCTDKTGTLTEDRIVLEKYLDTYGNESYDVLKYAYLNSYFQSGLNSNIDEAVINKADKMEVSNISEKFTKIDEVPFDFSRRRLSVVVEDDEKNRLLITKGAVEEILNISTSIEHNKQVAKITNEIKNNIKKIAKELNSDGLRVVAVCKKDNLENKDYFEVSDENNMTLVGFIGFLDPPKESAKESIEKLNNSGIRVIVLTGDNVEVTRCICNKVGINSNEIVTGNQIDKLSDFGVKRILKKTNIFAKLSPIQKARIVRLLKDSGNVVGYMGDGINDSPSLVNSDVGISVDTAVDIAKESADIILLEKDLNVLLDGVEEGRKTFSNLMKYIKLAVSFNFGEVSSVIIASIFLPFLPETPIQLLVESLLYDFGQLTLPLDNVDKVDLKKPKKFELSSLKHFMLFMGPLSSAFDLIIFLLMWFVLGIREAGVFQSIWFSYSIVSNLIGMHIIRTSKKPFVESIASEPVYFSSIILSIVGILVPFTFVGHAIGLVSYHISYISIIIGVTLLYCIIAIFAKKIYMKKYKEWI